MQNTESFWRGNIWQTITSAQTVPFDLKVSYIPVNDNQYITVSPDDNNEEIMFYSVRTGTAWEAWEITITGRGYNKHNSTQDAGNNKEHDINSVFKLANNHIILNEKADKTDLASTSNGEWASTIGIEDSASHFTATDVEGALAELAVGAPWVADANLTIAGKVEEATDAEVTAWTDVWGTWAKLFSTLVQTIKSISLKWLVTSSADADEFVINQWGVDKRISQTNIRESIAASVTQKGTVEVATDAEALARTDATKVITPKHLGDMFKVQQTDSLITNMGSFIVNSGSSKWREITIGVAGTYRIKFNLGWDTWSGTCSAQVKVDGATVLNVPFNDSEAGVDTVYDLTFAVGESLEIWGTDDGDNAEITEIKLCGTLVPHTVVL